MEYKVSDVKPAVQIHTCRNCKHQFAGKICNQCGEKVFNENQLTAKHFLHQVIDFFWHWENKVLKTIKLNTFKPGFVTKENLNGIRVPYAKPVQLYLVMSIIFFLGVTKIGVTDYIPALYDYQYYKVSNYKTLKWAKPVDDAVNRGIIKLIYTKHEVIVKDVEEMLKKYGELDSTGGIMLQNKTATDSIYISKQRIPVYIDDAAKRMFNIKFKTSIAAYGKTLIFFILPFIAAFIFLFFFKKLKYYGAALIFGVHFMVYNMVFYLVISCIYKLPKIWFDSNIGFNLTKPFELLFYNSYAAPVSNFLIGQGFEFDHFLFWMPWLFFAFKRLFNTVWWKNVLISWICCRIFFFLIFGVLKTALIAFTIWSMH
jgi:Protein of unknown function (DUF3667)